jgi:hypothetical protein
MIDDLIEKGNEFSKNTSESNKRTENKKKEGYKD